MFTRIAITDAALEHMWVMQNSKTAIPYDTSLLLGLAICCELISTSAANATADYT